MKNCHYCGNKESYYVCKSHARNMLTKEDLKNTVNYNDTTYFKNENNEQLYDINDLRKRYSYTIFNNEKINQETLDSFFRFKTMTELAYHKKILREKRKHAIEEFTYHSIKKLNSLYFSEYRKHIDDLIEIYTNKKTLTPAECALIIYKEYESFILYQNAKQTRTELASDYLNIQEHNIKKIFDGGILHIRFINGDISYESFVKEITNHIEKLKREKMLETELAKYIPLKYHKMCTNTKMANDYVKQLNTKTLETLIIFFVNIIKQYEMKTKKGLRNTHKFFKRF